MTRCRLCGSASAGERRRPRRDPAVRELPRRGPAGSAGTHVPAAPAGLHRLPARADPAADHAGGHLHRVRVLLLVLDLAGWSTRSTFVADAAERLGLGADALRGRGRQQRRLPAAARGRRGDPLPRHRAVGERRRGGAGRGRAHRDGVPRRGDRRGGPRRARPGGPGRGQQRVRAHPRPASGSPGRCAPWSPTTAGSRIEVQHLLHPDRARTSTTRSTTSTSSTTRSRPRRGRSPAAGSRVVDVELLPTHGGSIRCGRGPPRSAGEPTAAGGRRAGTERRPPGCTSCPGTPSSPPAVAKVRQDLLRFLLEAAERRQDGRRLRRTGQGQHAAQPLRHPDRPARVHGRPQPVQARPVHARARASRSSRRSRSPRTGPTSSSSCRGTSGRADRATVLHRATGAAGSSSPSRN